MNMYKTTKELLNEYLDFDTGIEQDVIFLLKTPEGLFVVNDPNMFSIYKDDFDIDDEIEIGEESIKVFELTDFFTTIQKIEYYQKFLIHNTIMLFEEIFMHEDTINRNIKKIEYVTKIINILKEKK